MGKWFKKKRIQRIYKLIRFLISTSPDLVRSSSSAHLHNKMHQMVLKILWTKFALSFQTTSRWNHLNQFQFQTLILLCKKISSLSTKYSLKISKSKAWLTKELQKMISNFMQWMALNLIQNKNGPITNRQKRTRTKGWFIISGLTWKMWLCLDSLERRITCSSDMIHARLTSKIWTTSSREFNGVTLKTVLLTTKSSKRKMAFLENIYNWVICTKR